MTSPKNLIIGHLKAVDCESFGYLAGYLLDQCQTIHTIEQAKAAVEDVAIETILSGQCEKVEYDGRPYLNLLWDN